MYDPTTGKYSVIARIAVRGVRHPAVHAATTERFRRLRLGTGPDGGVNR